MTFKLTQVSPREEPMTRNRMHYNTIIYRKVWQSFSLLLRRTIKPTGSAKQTCEGNVVPGENTTPACIATKRYTHAHTRTHHTTQIHYEHNSSCACLLVFGKWTSSTEGEGKRKPSHLREKQGHTVQVHRTCPTQIKPTLSVDGPPEKQQLRHQPLSLHPGSPQGLLWCECIHFRI